MRSAYLDTSAISLLFQDDSPERQEVTREFFKHLVIPGRCRTVISPVVVDELGRTPDQQRLASMIQLIATLKLEIVPFDEGDPIVARLVAAYFRTGLIPPGKREDALHVALATKHGIDMLVTWNYRHLANPDREAGINGVNAAQGFATPLRMLTPSELTHLWQTS